MDNQYQRLSEKAKKSWFFARLILLVILILMTLVSLIFIKNTYVKLALYIFMGLFIFLQLLSTFLYPKIEYRQWKYSIAEDKIELIHGIYYITTTIIPIVRIQNINIKEGPINRHFALADVEIVTAGGNFNIPNIEKDKASEISEHLKKYININVPAELEESHGEN